MLAGGSLPCEKPTTHASEGKKNEQGQKKCMTHFPALGIDPRFNYCKIWLLTTTQCVPSRLLELNFWAPELQ
jgi:hypothetical protein